MSYIEASKRKLSEVQMNENDFIVSKTDSNNTIIYVNKAFCDISGYSESELIGESHDIVRNEQMPLSIYDLMREHLQAEEEFFGYFLNKNKNDTYYWTLINVTPCYDNNNLSGYFAARRAPSSNALKVIKPLYQKMLEIENSSPEEQKLPLSSAILWQAITKEYKTYAEFVLSL